MRIDHIGYAVKNIEKSITRFEELGYEFGEIISDNDRNVFLAFGENGGYVVELVSPMNKDGSPIDDILKKNGNTPYHICYSTENLEEEISKLSSKRFKVMIPQQKAIAFDNKRVVFMYNPSVGLIEIVEE